MPQSLSAVYILSYFQQNIASHFSKMKACALSYTHSWEALQKRWNVRPLLLVASKTTFTYSLVSAAP